MKPRLPSGGGDRHSISRSAIRILALLFKEGADGVPFSISLIRNNQEWGSEYLEKVSMASLDTSHIVKYYCSVHIVTRKHLRQAMENCQDAGNEIKAWGAILTGVLGRVFKNF